MGSEIVSAARSPADSASHRWMAALGVRNAAPSSLNVEEGRLRLRNAILDGADHSSLNSPWGQRARETGIHRARYVRYGDMEQGEGMGAPVLRCEARYMRLLVL